VRNSVELGRSMADRDVGDAVIKKSCKSARYYQVRVAPDGRVALDLA